MSEGRTVATRLLVTALVALLVVGLAGIVPLLAPSSGIDGGPDHPEYDADRLAPERLEASGNANPRGDVGVVLFDRSHGNRVEGEEVSSLVRAVDQAGGEVQFTGHSGGLASGLSEADVLVIVDPATSYTPSDVDAVERFVDNGGRVLILGEPNRKAVESEGLEVGLSTRRSKVTTVASPFGISFGTQYLYDMEANDGNFKNVVTSPPDGTNAEVVDGIDQVALYTAVTVEANRGTVLLRTARTAERSDERTPGGFPVAVLSPGGNVMAVGDKTFLAEEYHAVADNDVLVQRIVEFMAQANQEAGQSSADTGETATPE